MDIDFVIIWVDGNDVEWQKKKEYYTPEQNTDNRVNRYRDWDNLQYWFRGVENYAPWVRKIHFVTCGHLPEWLDVNNPKLNIVKHVDYIPQEYLPTFSANPIELNIHRIKGLSNKFVFFNDDTFLIKPTKETTFFKNNLPCDIAALDAVSPTELFSYILVNNLNVINKNFDKKQVLKTYKWKWFNLKYGKELYKTSVLFPWKNFTGFFNHHLPIAFKKETLEEVWKNEYEVLNKTCYNKFRNKEDLSGWLFRYWRLAKGEFHPIGKSIGRYYAITSKSDSKYVGEIIKKQRYNMICINDDLKEECFEKIQGNINASFKRILPEKSSFEL